MNTIKSIGLVGLAVSAMFASQAFATTCGLNHQGTQTQGSPVCIAPVGTDGAGTGLQDLLDGITQPGTTNHIDVYNDQTSPSAYWSIGATGGSENTKMFQITANAGNINFGIFDPTDPGNYLSLFAPNAQTGWSTTLKRQSGSGNYIVTYSDADGVNVGPQMTGHFGVNNLFGYYIKIGDIFYYSDPLLNNGNPYMVTLNGDNSTKFCITGPDSCGTFLSNEYILAWEDGNWATSDLDYNDFVVMVESVHPVPEPATLGMFGLGVLLLGGFAALRRRSSKLEA